MDLAKQKVIQVTAPSELPEAVVKKLPDIALEQEWDKPNPIFLTSKSKGSVSLDKEGGHYFMGGLPALMQAVRKLKQEPNAFVTFVNDGRLQKSTQSAHQGHVHPTEWTTPECRVKHLTRMLLNAMHIMSPKPPEDVENYSYVHFPLSSIQIGLFLRFFVHRVAHTLLAKNGASDDDRWQCKAVRASLALHKELSDEIESTGGEPTFRQTGRIMWTPHKGSIETRKALWDELGIQTEPLSRHDLKMGSLLKEEAPIYALNVIGDGKYFAEVDRRITKHLSKKHPGNFQTRTARVAEVYLDEATKQPFAVREVLPDGTSQTIAIDAFFGSTGHCQVFKEQKPLWQEVPVTGVSTLWVCTIPKLELYKRFNLETDEALQKHLKELVGTANHTNLHLTIWDAVIDNSAAHIIVRATEGANFNSESADPTDLVNMTCNLNRFYIGSWKLISVGTCTRKTTIPNIPVLKENFIHGLSGIGLSFSGAPIEMLEQHQPLTTHFIKKLFHSFFAK